MSLKLGDGFDHYPTAMILNKWDGARGHTIDALYGRLGSKGCRTFNEAFTILGQGCLSKNLTSANSEHGFFGAAIHLPAMPASGNINLFAVYDPITGSAMHICSMVGADGSIGIGYCTINNFSFGVTTLARSVPGLIVAATWYYVEMKVKVNNTSGFVEVLVNGISAITLSGDTAGWGNGFGSGISTPTSQLFSNVKLGGDLDATVSSGIYFDDFYYCDDTGAQNNTYLGDVKLQAIYPDGVGSSTQFINFGGPANWDSVNETSPDDDTTYVYENTVNDSDLYTMQDLSATVTSVKGLLCNARIKKDDATVRTYALLVKSGATTGEVATRAAPFGAYTNQQDVSELNPATLSAWTVAEVNAMEAGIKIKS